MPSIRKNWDRHVAHAEEVARSPGFTNLRDRIVALADPQAGELAVDVGAGTGLLTLPLAATVNRVFAIDIAEPMCQYVRTKAASGGYENVEVAVASAVSLPLMDGSADLVVSNYCFHHLAHQDKERALAEIHRVLRPGGRLVFGDMMFQVSLTDARDRRVIGSMIRRVLRRGPAGIARLARNGLRLLVGRWDQPARADWWEEALRRAGFEEIRIDVLEHEGGIASARRP